MKVLLAGFHAPGFGPSLGMGCLYSYVKAQPDLAGTADLSFEDLSTMDDPAAAQRAVLRARPDLVAMTCLLWNMKNVLALARFVKQTFPACRVAVGGPEVAERALAFLQENPEIDLVCTEEGEETFACLLRALAGGGELAGVHGLAYRRGGRIEQTPDRALLPDLAAVPSPFLTGVFPNLSRPWTWVILETSRGCPFDCKFCDWMTGQRVRDFPEERVLREFELLIRDRVGRAVMLADADIFLNRPRAKRLLRHFIRVADEERFGLLVCEANLAHLDDELIDILGGTHRVILDCGIQSTNPEALRRNTRGLQKDKVEHVLEQLRKRAPHVNAKLHLIAGLPGDTVQGWRSSADWGLSRNPTQLNFYLALYLNGSGYARSPEKFPMEKDPEYNIIRATDTMGRDELRRVHELGNSLFTLYLLRFVREPLYEIARRRGGPQSFLTVYERFLGYYAQSGGDLERLGAAGRGTSAAMGYVSDEFLGREKALLHGLLTAMEAFVRRECASDPELCGDLLRRLERHARRLAWTWAREEGLWPFLKEAVWGARPAGDVLLAGDGLAADALFWAKAGARVTAFDLTASRYEEAQKLYPYSPLLRHEFCAAADLPTRVRGAGGPFSAVVLMDGAENARGGGEDVLRELRKRLAPGAAVLVSGWERSDAAWDAAVRAAGFTPSAVLLPGLERWFAPFSGAPSFYALRPAGEPAAVLA